MIPFAAGLLVGLIGLHLLASVPPLGGPGILLVGFALALWPRNLARFLGGLLLGMTLGAGHAQRWLDQVWPPGSAAIEAVIIGQVTGLPVQDERHSRFRIVVESILEGPEALRVQRLQVNAYTALPTLSPGDRLQLTVAIRPPRGQHNPGLFDYNTYLYREGLHGVATLRGSPQVLEPTQAMTLVVVVHRLRQTLQNALHQAHPEARHPGVLEALVIGERSGMERAEWDLFLQTGTNHLVAISGLHIGLIAGFALWLARLLWDHFPLLRQGCSRRVFSIPIALVAAALYAAMAGFSVPTQRALIMLLLFSTAALLGRNPWSWRVFAAALTFVLILDPAAVLAPGFWFSFLAVASILLFLQGRMGRPGFSGWIKLQVLLSLLLLPLGIAWFQLGSWLAPLGNLVAVPLVSFFILPLLLVGSGLALVSPVVAGPLLQLADLGVVLLLFALDGIIRIPIAVTEYAVPLFLILLATLAMLGLYLPRPGIYLPWMALACLPMLLPFQNGLASGEFSIRLLDTAAGQSLLIQTRQHRLLFDTGPHRNDQRQPLSLQVLKQAGIRQLDAVVTSHSHRDHAGALPAILEALPVTTLWGRVPESPETNHQECRKGTEWTWDGVTFRFLHPPPHWDHRASASCVLHVSSPWGSALITGGLSGLGQAVFLQNLDPQWRGDLLILPPRTPATTDHPLLQQIQPEEVWVAGEARSASPDRADLTGPQLRSTADDGQLRADFLESGPLFHPGSRNQSRRFWQPPPPDRRHNAAREPEASSGISGLQHSQQSPQRHRFPTFGAPGT